MKNFLFVMRQSPHSGSQCQEMLDIILTVAAFEQQVSLLFLDQGVLQLNKNQNPDCLAMTDTAAIFKALEIYEIKRFYVEVESLQNYGLKSTDLLLAIQEIPRQAVSQLMQQHLLIF